MKSVAQMLSYSLTLYRRTLTVENSEPASTDSSPAPVPGYWAPPWDFSVPYQPAHCNIHLQRRSQHTGPVWRVTAHAWPCVHLPRQDCIALWRENKCLGRFFCILFFLMTLLTSPCDNSRLIFLFSDRSVDMWRVYCQNTTYSSVGQLFYKYTRSLFLLRLMIFCERWVDFGSNLFVCR